MARSSLPSENHVWPSQLSLQTSQSSAFIDKETIYQENRKSLCMPNYTIKSKYLQSLKPFLSNEQEIKTKFTQTIYNQKPKADPIASPKEPVSDPKAKTSARQPPAKQQQAPTQEKDLLNKQSMDYTIQAKEIIEREPDDFNVELSAPWLQVRSKTAAELKDINASKERDQKGYIAPEGKPERAVTKGRFPVEVRGAAEQFNVDKSWQLKANPGAWEAQKKFEEWDRNMMVKKRNQKLLKQQLIEDGIKNQDQKAQKNVGRVQKRK